MHVLSQTLMPGKAIQSGNEQIYVGWIDRTVVQKVQKSNNENRTNGTESIVNQSNCRPNDHMHLLDCRQCAGVHFRIDVQLSRND